MRVKKFTKNFQMSVQSCGCLDKMSEVNFSPAETLLRHSIDSLFVVAPNYVLDFFGLVLVF